LLRRRTPGILLSCAPTAILTLAACGSDLARALAEQTLTEDAYGGRIDGQVSCDQLEQERRRDRPRLVCHATLVDAAAAKRHRITEVAACDVDTDVCVEGHR
jgi:hypothetical protein